MNTQREPQRRKDIVQVIEHLILPKERLVISSPLGTSQLLERLSSVPLVVRSPDTGTPKISISKDGKTVEFVLAGRLGVFGNKTKLSGSLIPCAEGTRFEAEIIHSSVGQGFIRAWIFLMLAILGAILFFWVAGVLSGQTSGFAALESLMIVVLFVIALGAVAALHARTLRAVHRTQRDSLLRAVRLLMSEKP